MDTSLLAANDTVQAKKSKANIWMHKGKNAMDAHADLQKDGPVTIKDNSKRLHISAVSVHRALSGKEGVSDKLRNQVLRTAKEMGYEINYAAASLKRKPTRVAVVLPQDGGLYFAYIWKGMRASLKEVKGLNVEVEEFVCQSEDEQYDILRQIADEGDAFAGVITFSFTRQPRVLLQFQRLIAQGTMLVVVDDELKEPEGAYCVPANEKILGETAGEFVSMIVPDKGAVVITSGRTDSKIHINKVNSFIGCLAKNKPDLKVYVVEGYYNDAESDDRICKAVGEVLAQHPETVACYALTSHDNVPMVRAVEQAGMADRVSVVGTDLNQSTSDMLRKGQLKAVLNQAAYMKGYAAMYILVDRVVKNIEPPRRFDCQIDVVIRSNLSFYERSNNIIAWR